MKPDILLLGRFPDATMVELQRRYEVHHFSPLPKPEAITAQMSARIHGVAAEANHGLTRALLERLPQVGEIFVFGVGTGAVETRVAMGRLMIDNLAAGLEKKPLLTPVAA